MSHHDLEALMRGTRSMQGASHSLGPIALEPGTWGFCAWGDDWAALRPRPIVLERGRRESILIEVPTARRSIVLAMAGEPLAGVAITVSSHEHGGYPTGWSSTTDAEGGVTVALDAGTVTWSTRAAPHASATVEWPVPDGTVIELEVQ